VSPKTGEGLGLVQVFEGSADNIDEEEREPAKPIGPVSRSLVVEIFGFADVHEVRYLVRYDDLGPSPASEIRAIGASVTGAAIFLREVSPVLSPLASYEGLCGASLTGIAKDQPSLEPPKPDLHAKPREALGSILVGKGSIEGLATKVPKLPVV
jgi:hypothetical protein